jgi:hypothetical protein
MKLALSILLFALCVSAQNLMPPTNFPVIASTNEVPMPNKHPHLTVEWTGSISPNVVGYRIYKATDLLGPRCFYGFTTIDIFTVDITNGVSGFYWITAINSAGIESRMVGL